MDRIRKWLHRASIPAAFIICALFGLLAANLLTKATVRFSQKNMSEIEAEYATVLPMDTVDFITGEFTGNFGAQLVDDEQAPIQLVRMDGEQLLWQRIPLPEEAKKQYEFYVGLDDIAAVLWYSVCLCLAALIFYLWKLKKPW